MDEANAMEEANTMDEWLDQAGPQRPGEALDAGVVGEFLRQRLPELSGDPRINQYPGGASNLTYELIWPERTLILRRPPFGAKARSAHDMGREFRIQQALKPVYPWVPQMVAYCEDASLLGAPFYVMEKLAGIIPRADFPKGIDGNPGLNHRLCRNALDKLVALHQVDPETTGLTALHKGPGYVRRQISGWSDRYRRARTDNVPGFEDTMAWLEANQPEDNPPCLIHNDFRMDNLVLDAQDPGRIIGVLDWEMATIGDPLMDLGNSLAYWVETDDPPFLRAIRRQPTHLPGMMTRQQAIDYYCGKTGFNPDNFDFYRLYGLFRLAVIVQQIYYRFHHGQTRNPAFANFHAIVQFLDQYCNQLLRKTP